MGSLGRQGRVGDGMLACCSADGSLARHAAVPRVAQPAWRAWAMGHDPSGSGVDGLAYARRHVPCCANRPASDGLGEALLQWEPGLGGEGREATAGGQIEQRAWRRRRWWPSIMCSSSSSSGQPAASQPAMQRRSGAAADTAAGMPRPPAPEGPTARRPRVCVRVASQAQLHTPHCHSVCALCVVVPRWWWWWWWWPSRAVGGGLLRRQALSRSCCCCCSTAPVVD